MSRIFLAFIFCLLSLTPIKAEVLKDLVIEGNKRVSSETIKLYGGIKLQEDLTQKDLNTIIQNLYETEFFEDIKLNFENSVLRVTVKEFKIINQLVIIGEKSNRYLKEIKRLIKSKEKKSFIKTNLSEDINTIKQLYSSIGFNSVDIVTKTKQINDNNIDLIFEISKGNVSKISSIEFIGDKKIRSRRLKSIIASEEDKFYKIISRNTKFNKDLITLDIRLLNNYYRSLGYKDVKVLSNMASIESDGNINITYTINAGQRFTINKISTKVDTVLEEKLISCFKQSL